MSILNKYNKGSQFDFQTPEHFEFKKLSELYVPNAKADENLKPLNALFINTKSKFGNSPVAVTDNELVNLPGHLLESVEQMISDDEVVQMINEGKAAIEIYQYESKNWGTNYSVNFTEQLPF